MIILNQQEELFWLKLLNKMKNPISYLYEKTDDAIMHFVNKGVKAWNWTTGKSKADLVNKMLCVAPIGECVGDF